MGCGGEAGAPPAEAADVGELFRIAGIAFGVRVPGKAVHVAGVVGEDGVLSGVGPVDAVG